MLLVDLNHRLIMLGAHLFTKPFSEFIEFSNNVLLFSLKYFYPFLELITFLQNLLKFKLVLERFLLQALLVGTILLKLFHLILNPPFKHILVLGQTFTNSFELIDLAFHLL